LTSSVERGSPSAGIIPHARAFYFDDMSTHVAEHHSTERASEHPREIEYFDRTEI